MWYYPISGLINGLTLSLLGIFVFARNRKSPLNITYAIFCIFISFWSYSYFLWQISKNSKEAFFWCQMLMLGAIFIPSSYFHFVTTLIDKYSEKNMRRIVYFAYLLAGFFAILNFTPLMIIDVKPRLRFPFWPTAGSAYKYFLIYFAAYSIYGCYLLLKEAKKAKGIKRNQVLYVFIGSVLGYIGGATNFPLWYDIKIYPVGNILSSVYVSLVAYAILRYRLMDITVAITRTGIFIAVYTFVLGLPFAVAFLLKNRLTAIFGGYWWTLPLGLMAVLATVGPFIYIYVERRAEARLLKEQRRYQNTLKQASLGMTRIRDLRRLLDLIAHIVTKTVKISYAAIYLYNKDTDEYLLQVSRDKGKGRNSPIRLDSKNPIVVWCAYKHQPLIYEEIKRQKEDLKTELYSDLEEQMRLLNASVVIPSFLDDRLMGFIVLGDKLSNQVYTRDDINVFEVLASQAALAIENAQFYEETKHMQEQIAQAEKMSTIGTMADGLSHQINNRLYALSLIAGDTIDTIRMTDTSTCAPEVKEMINQINHALNRIQTNVIQGGEIVRGLLKYSRQDDTTLEPLDLSTVLDNTLEMVQYKVKLSEIDIHRDFNNLPKIKGNLVQLEEVFFNFIDNAYDAILERKSTLKEPGYRGRITISALPKSDSTVEITVEDNGIGIKSDNLKKLFTPFFTTKTSSRRGTGLGLYVIRKIITDTHKGNIQVESEYGLGTRFILELPVSI